MSPAIDPTIDNDPHAVAAKLVAKEGQLLGPETDESRGAFQNDGPAQTFTSGPQLKVFRIGGGSGWWALALVIVVPLILFAGFFVFLGISVLVFVLRTIYSVFKGRG